MTAQPVVSSFRVLAQWADVLRRLCHRWLAIRSLEGHSPRGGVRFGHRTLRARVAADEAEMRKCLMKAGSDRPIVIGHKIHILPASIHTPELAIRFNKRMSHVLQREMPQAILVQ